MKYEAIILWLWVKFFHRQLIMGLCTKLKLIWKYGWNVEKANAKCKFKIQLKPLFREQIIWFDLNIVINCISCMNVVNCITWYVRVPCHLCSLHATMLRISIGYKIDFAQQTNSCWKKHWFYWLSPNRELNCVKLIKMYHVR